MTIVRAWAALAVLATAAWATTWEEDEEPCPLCGATVKVMEVASYGTYIYNWDSKFQYVYWPFTEDYVLYVCGRCKFTWFNNDVQGLAEADKTELKAVLSSAGYGSFDDYYTIPMSTRLKTAEGIYRLLGRDDDWWARFYRVQGYWWEAEGNAGRAAEARRRALALAEKAAADPKKAGRKKEYLYAAAAMHHYLGEDDKALAALEAAAALTFKDPSREDEDNRSFDKYLTALIAEYREKIKKRQVTGRNLWRP